MKIGCRDLDDSHVGTAVSCQCSLFFWFASFLHVSNTRLRHHCSIAPILCLEFVALGYRLLPFHIYQQVRLCSSDLMAGCILLGISTSQSAAKKCLQHWYAVDGPYTGLRTDRYNHIASMLANVVANAMSQNKDTDQGILLTVFLILWYACESLA